jgi:hypothetical protein
MQSIRKYPRTPHLEGSRLQAGDYDLSQIKFSEIAGRHLVVEEKIDGANCGIGFDSSGELRLQSRGHYLTGGPREQQFALLKQWTSEHLSALYECLGSRYLMYGEWMFAKHTVFYNRLPNYFLEFDVFDTQEDIFLSTPSRRRLLKDLPIHTAPVLHEGPIKSLASLQGLIGNSAFIDTDAKLELDILATEVGEPVERVFRETDVTGLMEGLYIKVEEEDRVVDRLKFVRADFLAIVDNSGSHWQDRRLVRNKLAAVG